VRILVPFDGAEIDAQTVSALEIRVAAPALGAALVLSLDGARPRPVVSGSLAVAELVDGGATLGAGAHDLVLAAVGADGIALDPEAGGVAVVRFFVGAPRTSVTPPSVPRVVCLSPFGTTYGKSPSIALDYVVTAGSPSALTVSVVGPGGSRRARVEGRGPFALGTFPGGDHEVTLAAPPGAPPVLPGRCVFTHNPELERSP
jgi:hypothetical protein